MGRVSVAHGEFQVMSWKPDCKPTHMGLGPMKAASKSLDSRKLLTHTHGPYDPICISHPIF